MDYNDDSSDERDGGLAGEKTGDGKGIRRKRGEGLMKAQEVLQPK